MNKTSQSLFQRRFLIETLPEPLTAASGHLQILDRYIAGTRLRLRQIRIPETNEHTRILQQRIVMPNEIEIKSAEIHLDETEYIVFESLGRREVRKNRYFHEFDRVPLIFDVFLGPLHGLKLAVAEFDTRHEAEAMTAPVFSVREVTHFPVFMGEMLAALSFDDVAKALNGLSVQMS
jgi:CYTH domain-containing protein